MRLASSKTMLFLNDSWTAQLVSERKLQAAVYVTEVELAVGRKLLALVKGGGRSKLDPVQDFMSDTDSHCLQKLALAGLKVCLSSRDMDSNTHFSVPPL